MEHSDNEVIIRTTIDSTLIIENSIREGVRVLHTFWLKGGADAPPWLRQGGHFEVKEGHPIFTNNMIFLECGVIALFEAFYMLRDHNHETMKF